ncbi:MAG: patatin-like phospholipase family protein [bacterium]
MAAASSDQRVGFVLGGGGLHGAAEVGMLAALDEAGIEPDLLVGTSVGAINGALIAAHPAGSGVTRLTGLWESLGTVEVFSGSAIGRLVTLARTRTHLHSQDALEAVLERNLPPTFEDLRLPFQCVAASVERATARWFGKGDLVPAILASCAVPGLFPPVEIDGEHHMDGGLVHSIPVGRAIDLGATEVFVLHVGRIETPLTKPRHAVDVAFASFEIARRHRFFEEIERFKESAAIHVLPAAAEGLGFNDLTQFRYRDARRIATSIEQARAATARYLAEIGRG